MADPSAFQIFSPYREDPEILRRRKMAEALMMQSLSAEPVRSPVEAISRPIVGLLAGLMNQGARDEETARRKAISDVLMRSTQEQDPEKSFALLAGHEATAPLAYQQRMDEAKERRTVDRLLTVEREKQKLQPPKIEKIFDEQGREIAAQYNPFTRKFEPIGGAKSNLMTPEEFDQKVRIARASRQPVETWGEVQLPDGRRVQRSSHGQIRELPGQGTLQGSGLDAQFYNILLDPRADTASPQYHAAYAHLTAPRVTTVDGVPTQITPQLPENVRKPTAAAAAPAAPTPPAPASAAPGAAAPAPTDSGQPAKPSPANAQGVTLTPLGPKSYTNDQNLAGGFADRMTQAEQAMDKVVAQGHQPGNIRDTAAGAVPFGAGNFAMSTQGQQYRQAQEDWVRAKLRKESGAAIPNDEMEREIRTYFPKVGDSPEVIEQKRRARQTATEAMKFASGGAYDALTAGRPKPDANALKSKYGLE